jgi:hypothetical protein
VRLILLAVAAALSASAAAETRDIPVPSFTAVRHGTAPDLIVRVGGPTSVRVEGDREAIDALQIGVQGEELVVTTRRGARWPRGRAKAVIYATTPLITKALTEGSGNIRIDRVSGAGFDGSAHGSGNLVIDDLRTEVAELSSHGSGNVMAAGSVTWLQAFASGSGNVDVRRLQARTGAVRTTGSGNVDATISEAAEVMASGSGRAHVAGTKTCRVRSTGSGGVSCG